MQLIESEASICRNIEKDIIDSLPIENNTEIIAPYYDDNDRISRLIKFNKELDDSMNLIQLNENLIESKLEELESILSVYDRVEKYSLIRLTELTLFCVGNYANHNCITDVGDFMVNPRLLLVHIKGEQYPVEKERHTALSVQFSDKETEDCSVAEWFKANTVMETVKKPILPHLLDLLKKISCAKEYIDSVKNQINMMIDLLSYLSMARIPKGTNIEGWKDTLKKNDRKMLESMFYRFDSNLFHDLGKKIGHKYKIDNIYLS